MTPAITLLKKKRIAHTILKYDHDSKAPSYGLEAADKLSLTQVRYSKPWWCAMKPAN